MNYDDFVLHIGERQEANPAVNRDSSGYAVRVLQSPAGEGSGLFQPPVDRLQTAALMARYRSEHDIAREGPSTALALDPTMLDAKSSAKEASAICRDVHVLRRRTETLTPEAYGGQLFDAIFRDQVRGLFDRSLGAIQSGSARGLRLKIRLDESALAQGELENLPWELLFRPESRTFLALDRHCSIVRYLDVPQPSKPIPLPESLRVLAVTAEPKSGLSPLNVQTELKKLELAAAANSNWSLKKIHSATVSDVRAYLMTEGPFHVIHFMGHGGFDPSTGEGVLFFENRDGSPQPVTGQALAAKLQDHDPLGLVFLNACETAMSAGSDGQDPFSGVACSLVRGGLPAVIAMQRPISDEAAILFSDTFYSSLAGGVCADEALVEARQAVHSAQPDRLEWAIPVLFARIRQGTLFEPPKELPKTAVRTFWPPWLALALLFLVGMLVVNPGGVLRAKTKTFSLGQVFVTDNDGVDGVIDRIELMGDGTMRVFFKFTNHSETATKLGFDLNQTYLADENGNAYEVLRAGTPLDVRLVEANVPAGESHELWFDVPAPKDGAKRFGVALANLAPTDTAYPYLEVTLPDYSKRFGTQSPEPISLAGAESIAVNAELAASVDALKTRVARVEVLQGQSMRWSMSMLNGSNDDLAIALDMDRVSLVDNLGHTYRPQSFGIYGRARSSDAGLEIRRGLRAEPWFEFGPPRPGAKNFSFHLATQPSSKIHFEQADIPLQVEHLAIASTSETWPTNLLTAPTPITSSLKSVQARVLGVYAVKPGSMRWRLEWLNTSKKEVFVGLHYPNTYLADSEGRHYPVKAAQLEAQVDRDAFRSNLLPGARLESWVDFAPPFSDAGALTLVLADTPATDVRLGAVTPTAFKWPGVSRHPLGMKDQGGHRLALDAPLSTGIPGLSARIESVELFGGDRDRMSWTLRLLSRSSTPHRIQLQAAGIQLNDSTGRNYPVRSVQPVDSSVSPFLAATLRVETISPRNRARTFIFTFSGKGFAEQEIAVELPSYPAELAKSEAMTLASFKLEDGEKEVSTTLKGLRVKLLTVDRLASGRLRWNLDFFNEGSKPLNVGFDASSTRLIQGAVQYRLDGTSSGPPSPLPVSKDLGRGAHWQIWLEFAGNFEGNELFQLILGSPDSARYRYRLIEARPSQ